MVVGILHTTYSAKPFTQDQAKEYGDAHALVSNLDRVYGGKVVRGKE